jgi:hypothetical protein
MPRVRWHLGMHDLDLMTRSLAVLVDWRERGFAHCVTAWCIGAGEWISAWPDDDPPSDRAVLLHAHTGAIAPIADWETRGGLVGFTCALDVPALAVTQQTLAKRMSLCAIGYPCVIDHPAFNLSRGSLDPERYLPYLCPWRVAGHLALFSVEDGWLTGRSFPGMAGAPVFTDTGEVAGVVQDSPHTTELPPLTRFHRLG